MATDFDRFVGSLLAGMSGPSSPAPQSPLAPRPLPVPQQRSPMQQIAQAAAGMPPELVAAVAQAAQQSVQQPAPQPQRPAPQTDMTPFVNAVGGDPRRMASTAPVASAPAREQQEEEAPAGEYVLVEYGIGPDRKMFFLPTDRMEELPPDTRIMDPTPVSDPEKLQRAKAGGFMYEDQPPEVRGAFTTAAEREQNQQTRAQNPTPVLPADQIAPSSGKALTGEQAAGIAAQINPASVPKEPVSMVSTQQMRESGDPDAIAMADALEANGINLVRSDEQLMRDPSTGKITKEPKNAPKETGPQGPKGRNPEPPGTDLPALTTEDLRKSEPEAANRIEEAGYNRIPDGFMAVELANNGPILMLPNTRQVPEGARILAYGGKSAPLAPKSILPTTLGEAAAPITEFGRHVPGAAWDATKAGVGVAGDKAEDALDFLREQNVGSYGDAAYQVAVGNVPDTEIDALRTRVAVAQTTGNEDLSVSPADQIRLWAYENPELAQDAYENGYTSPEGESFTGGRAVWESYVANKGLLFDVASGIVNDPLNRLTATGKAVDAVATGIRGADEAITATRAGTAGAVDVIGRLLRAPDELTDAAVRGVVRPVGDVIQATPGLRQLASPSVRQWYQNTTEPLEQTFSDIMARARRMTELGQQSIPNPPERRTPGGGSDMTGPVNPDARNLPPRSSQVVTPEGNVAMAGQPRLETAVDRGADLRTPLGGPDAEPVPAAVVDEVVSQPGPLLTRAIDEARGAGRDAAEVVREVVTNLPTPRDARGFIGDLTEEARQRLTPVQQEVYEAVRGVQSRIPDVDLPNAGAVVDDLAGATAAETRRQNPPVPTPAPVAGLPPGDQLRLRQEQAGIGAPAPRAATVPDEPAGLMDDFSPVEDAVPDRPVPMDEAEKPAWRFLSPRETGPDEAGRIIDRAWAARTEHPQAWAEFYEEYDGVARRFEGRQTQLNDLSKAERLSSGRTEYDWPTRRQQQVDEARHILDDLVPTYNGTVGEATQQPLKLSDYRIQHDPSTLSKKAENWNDAQLIENAIFNTGKNQRKAMRELNRRAETDPDLARRMRDSENGDPGIVTLHNRVRTELSGQRTLDDAVQQTSTAQAGIPAQQSPPSQIEIRDLPLSQIRTARNLTPDQRADLGLPDFQMRGDDYAEETVNDIVNNFDENRLDPIKVMQARDGNYYVTSGHSRLEAFDRMNREAIPAHIQRGDVSSVARAAEFSNTSGTNLNLIEQGQVARRRIEDRKETPEQVASAMKIKKPEVARYVAASHVPEGPIREGVVGNTIRLDMAAALGEGVQKEIMTPQELNSFYTRVVVPESLTPADVRAEIIAHAQMKTNRGTGTTAMFGDADLGSSGFWETRAQLAGIRKQIRAEDAEIKRWRGVAKRSKLSTEQRRLQRAAEGRAQELRQQLQDAITAPPTTAAPVDTPPITSAGEDLLRPMTEDDAAARQARDVPETPANIPVDQTMRNNPGARSLFAVNDPQRNAENLYTRTLGRRVPNRNAAPRPSLVRASTGTTYKLRGRDIEDFSDAIASQRFGDGETVGKRWERYADELEQFGEGKGKFRKTYTSEEAENIAKARVMNDWAVENLKSQFPKRYALYEQELARLSKNPRGELKLPAVREARALGHAVKYGGHSWDKALEAYDTTLAILREMVLYNTYTGPRYIQTQAVGNAITALLTGNSEIIGPALKNVPSAIRDIQRPASEMTPSEQLRAEMTSLGELPAHVLHDPTDAFLARMGWGDVRDDMSAAVRDQITPTESKQLHLRQFAERGFGHRRIKVPFAGEISSVFANKWIRDIANGFDLSYRKTHYGMTGQANVAQLRQDFYRYTQDRLPDGIDPAMLDAMWTRLPLHFDADRVRLVFSEIDPKWADRMARDWQNSSMQLRKAAREEVNRVFFSGDETNADAILRRVVFFHYWMSRATPLYTASLMKNPGVMNAFFNVVEEMQEEAESGQYGESVKGFLKLMGTPQGYNIFIRPDAFFQTFLAFGNDSEFTPEGENMFGMWMRKAEKFAFINPILGTVVKLSGAQGETFAPDPLMLGQWSRLVQTGLDFSKSQGWIENTGPTGNFYQEAMERLGTKTSGVIPGTTNLDFNDSTMYARRDINNLILDVAEERGLETDDPQVLAASEDPESPLYQEAFSRYVEANGISAISRVLPTSLLYPKLRPQRADETNYQMDQLEMGSEAWGDLYSEKDIAQTADPQARALKIQQNEYHELGTPAQQAAYDTYNGIKYGGLDGQARIGGVMRTERQLSGLDENQRAAAADAWAAENDKSEDIAAIREQRKTYRESHPEYGAYADWANSVRDHEGGVYSWWEQTARDNRNAARWLSEQNEAVSLDELDRDLTGIDAYMAASGIQSSVYEPVPLETGSGNAQVSGTGQSPYPPSDPAQRIADNIARYTEESAMIQAQLEQEFGPGVTMEYIERQNPMLRDALKQHMRDAGIEAPSLSSNSREYMEWAAAQSPGSDTSINAFLAWRNATMGPPVSAPDNAGSLQLEDLIRIIGQ